MRAMPSPAEMIVPSSETSTPPLNPSICCLRTLVISSALISAMPPSPRNRPSVRPGEPLAQDLELVPQGSVIHPGSDPRSRPAQEGRVDPMHDSHLAPGDRLERLPKALQLRCRQRHGRGGLRLHESASLVLDLLEGLTDGGESPQAPVDDEQHHEVAHRLAQLGLAR